MDTNTESIVLWAILLCTRVRSDGTVEHLTLRKADGSLFLPAKELLEGETSVSWAKESLAGIGGLLKCDLGSPEKSTFETQYSPLNGIIFVIKVGEHTPHPDIVWVTPDYEQINNSPIFNKAIFDIAMSEYGMHLRTQQQV